MSDLNGSLLSILLLFSDCRLGLRMNVFRNSSQRLMFSSQSIAICAISKCHHGVVLQMNSSPNIELLLKVNMFPRDFIIG
uniref:Secreted protein n=1 Tax=Panstrongylus lignarius TaxID=156445 RepID=A0A224Y3A7_9HEMI